MYCTVLIPKQITSYHSVRKVSDLIFFPPKTWWISIKRTCMRRPWTLISMHEFFLSHVNGVSWWQAAFEWGSVSCSRLIFIVRKMTGSRSYPWLVTSYYGVHEVGATVCPVNPTRARNNTSLKCCLPSPNRCWLPRSKLALQIRSYSNFKRFWLGANPIHYLKIPPTPGIEPMFHLVVLSVKHNALIGVTKWPNIFHSPIWTHFTPSLFPICCSSFEHIKLLKYVSPLTCNKLYLVHSQNVHSSLKITSFIIVSTPQQLIWHW